MPLESGYYEVYNQPNVRLVDIRETPIERITPAGIRTTDVEREFDMIIYATGFDAITGAFDRIDVRGAGGRRLRDKWADGPRTYLGLQVVGFPNLFTLVGPHNAATFCNIPRCIEQNVDWVTALIAHMRERGHARVEATAEAEREWTEHVHETAQRMLFTQVDSWMMGINSNVAGKQKRTFIVYAGGAPKYREKCDEVAAGRLRRVHVPIGGLMAAERDYDVVVVGAGNAALAAAVSAREHGAGRVVALEKAPRELRGGNTHYSGGLLRFAYDRPEDLLPLVPERGRQVPDFPAGVEPYPAKRFRADLDRVTEGRSDPELSEILIGRSFDTVRWMVQQGIVMEPAVSLSAVKVGNTIKWSPGAIIRARHEGVGLSAMWFKAAQAREVEIRYDTSAVRLAPGRARAG